MVFGPLCGSWVEVDKREIQWVKADKVACCVKQVEKQGAETAIPRAPDNASLERSGVYVNAQ